MTCKRTRREVTRLEKKKEIIKRKKGGFPEARTDSRPYPRKTNVSRTRIGAHVSPTPPPVCLPDTGPTPSPSPPVSDPRHRPMTSPTCYAFSQFHTPVASSRRRDRERRPNSRAVPAAVCVAEIGEPRGVVGGWQLAARAMWAAGGGRESSAAAVLRVLLIATACGLVFALLHLPLPDGRARSAGPGESSDLPRSSRRANLVGSAGFSGALGVCLICLADSDGNLLCVQVGSAGAVGPACRCTR